MPKTFSDFRQSQRRLFVDAGNVWREIVNRTGDLATESAPDPLLTLVGPIRWTSYKLARERTRVHTFLDRDRYAF